MENNIIFELIDNIFENIVSETCFDELSEYLNNKYSDDFKFIERGSNGIKNYYEFGIVFNNIHHSEKRDKYSFFTRYFVKLLRERGYSADSYVIGGVGSVFQVRSKEYNNYFEKLLTERRERIINVKQE